MTQLDGAGPTTTLTNTSRWSTLLLPNIDLLNHTFDDRRDNFCTPDEELQWTQDHMAEVYAGHDLEDVHFSLPVHLFLGLRT